MLAVEFPEANDQLVKPNKRSDEQVAGAPAWTGKAPIDAKGNMVQVAITYWKPNKEEIDDIIAGKGIYLISEMIPVVEQSKTEDGHLSRKPKFFAGVSFLTTDSPF
jgi:hypothetical protein